MGNNLYLPHVCRGHPLAHQRPYCVGAVQFQRGLGHVSCFVQREGADDLFGQGDGRWVHAELVKFQAEQDGDRQRLARQFAA